jgi:adenine-specific DNA-methyltransferase
MDEVFGAENAIAVIPYRTSVGLGAEFIDKVCDYIIWYGRSSKIKFRPLYLKLERGEAGATRYNYALLPDGREMRATDGELPVGTRYFTDQGLTSRRPGTEAERFSLKFRGKEFKTAGQTWRTTKEGLARALMADRLLETSRQVRFKKFFDDFGALALTNFWNDVGGGIQSRSDPKVYVVQTSTAVVERCILMATDPGDLVLDPTCGSGTMAYVAEQWGRRWITIDTSRVALALARTRLMAARYPWYLLADSLEGRAKEAALTQRAPADTPVHNDIRQGFVKSVCRISP